MPGFNAINLSYKVQSGNSVIVMIGDQTVAFAQTTDNAVDFGIENLYGIGTAKPQEIQQLRFSPTVTITSFALTFQGRQALNYPSTIVSVLANNAFDLHVMDRTGIPLLSFTQAICGNYSMNVPTNAVITENLSFNAMDVIDPTGQSILNGNFALNQIAPLAVGIGLNSIGL
jgi:hypothetical protein